MNNLKENRPKEYLYLISSRREYIHLCAMEMRYIFGGSSHKNYHLSESLIDINRSVFIKGVVSILYKDSSIDEIENLLIKEQATYHNYKIHFHKIDSVPYQSRLEAMRILGTAIQGNFSIKHPDIEFILTRINGEWVFGRVTWNDNQWKERRKKPHSYSHSLDIKIAKAAINIVINNDFNLSLIDPCCGIGTVVIEGRLLSINTKGYEINPLVKQKCNLNLEYYNMIPNVTKTDVLESTDIFDVAILDLPYGHYSNITREEQTALIKKTKSISSKAVIITMDNMSDIIEDTGYTIIDSCEIKKSNTFTRHVTLCQ